MKFMKRKLMVWGMALALVAALSGCSSKKEEAPKPVEQPPKETETVAEEPKQEPVAAEPQEVIPEGMARSYLSGQWIDEELAKKRPYAVMFGNARAAQPQYGISSADVVYEAAVEGMETRFMGIFQDTSGLDRIGSVRSCRHYYLYFAKEFDAIYAHFGQAIYALDLLARDDVHNISGLDGSVEGIAFYRTDDKKAPHNAYTSDQGLHEAAQFKGYRTEYADSYQGHYKFAEDNAPELLANGTDAKVIVPGYRVNKPWFVYHDDDGLYYRYQYDGEQLDGAAPEGQQQIAVKNILIQYCTWQMLDENGYLNVDTFPPNGRGVGKYITNGKMIDVTWTKENEDSPARYFDQSGNEITMNQGKTWVCAMLDSDADRFATFNSEEELAAARNQ